MSKHPKPEPAPAEPTPPPPGADPALADAGQQEEQALAALQADLEKFRDLALRSRADLDNYRKRAQREKEEAVRFANAKLLEELLPLLDSFELGLDAARKDPAAGAILQGMEMVQRQLADLLERQGAQAIDAAGAPFDPNLHEAVGQEPSTEVPEGHVVRQLRRGYTLRERLLRPASVMVSKGPPAS